MKELTDLVSKIVHEKKIYGKRKQFGLKKPFVSQLSERCLTTYNYKIPATYLEILKIADGIDHNGIVLYASKPSILNGYTDRKIEGICEANQLWRAQGNNQIFVFAESGNVLYIHNIAANQFQIVDRITQDEIYGFKSFDDLAKTILENMLDIFNY